MLKQNLTKKQENTVIDYDWTKADPTPILNLYKQLDRAWDEAAAGYVQTEGRSIACRSGCFDCCTPNGFAFKDTVAIALSPGEAVVLYKALRELPKQTCMEIIVRAMTYETRDHPTMLGNVQMKLTYKICPLLTTDGHCSVYHARPIICRTYGLPITPDDRNFSCPKTDVVNNVTNWMRQWSQTVKLAKNEQRANSLQVSQLQLISLALVIEKALVP